MKHPFALQAIAIVTLAMASAAALAQKQSWDYKSYRKDPNSGQYDKTRFVTSTVSVEEKDGKAVFRMITPGKGDPCFNQGELPAEVQRNAEIVTITVTPTLAGCAPFRYLIRTDGSGGVRQNQRDARWVDDGFDHGLTPQK
jgi:hypothetical protein